MQVKRKFVLGLLLLLLLFDLPLTWSQEFKVNTDLGKIYQGYPAVACNDSGSFVIVWEDQREGNYDIYAQRYDESNQAMGINFKVNDDTNQAQQFSPSIAMDEKGTFVIVWKDYRNGPYPLNPDIYGQRFDSSGQKLGSNFKVNSESPNANQTDPAIGMAGQGDFVITWTDFRNGNWDIYCQRYRSSGETKGTNFKVNSDAGTAYQHHSRVASDYWGNFVVVWYDYRAGNDNIYAQRFDSSGIRLSNNFLVNTDGGTSQQYNPDIASDKRGNFVIVWYDFRNSNGDIYAQIYNCWGISLGNNFKLNDDQTSEEQLSPAVAMDFAGNFAISWHDFRNKNFDIYSQKIDAFGSKIGSNLKVNSDSGIAKQVYAKVALNSSNIYFTWTDERNLDNGFDIYAEILPWARSYVPQIYVTDTTHSFGEVQVGQNQSWSFYIFNKGLGDLRINSASLTESVFTVTAPNFPDTIPLRDSIFVTLAFQPILGILYNSNLIIQSNDPYFPSLQISLSGQGFPYEKYPDPFSLFSPNQGEILDTLKPTFFWQASADSNSDDTVSYVLTYSQDSTFSSKNEISGIADTFYIFSNDLIENAKYFWKVKAVDNHSFSTWSNQSDWYFYVNSQNEPPTSFSLISPLNNRLLYTFKPNLIWQSSSDPDPLDSVSYYLKYDTSYFFTTSANVSLKDTIYICPDSLIPTAVYYWKVKAIDKDSLFFETPVWNFTVPEQTSVADQENLNSSRNLSLNQNFPNPFNSSTVIEFFLPKEMSVELAIFNVSGQRVKILVKEKLSKGEKRVFWDGKNEKGENLPSGVYVYKLKMGGISLTKKLVLLK
jgi:hypothetical protein